MSPRASRHPSMIDAWFSSSESTSVPGPAKVVRTPRLVAKPVGNRTAASVPFQSAITRSSSVCPGRDPTMSRAEHVDDPVDLLRSRREHRHHHDDVTERAQQHASPGGGGAHPATPPQVVTGRVELDPAHEALEAELLHGWVATEPLLEPAPELI